VVSAAASIAVLYVYYKSRGLFDYAFPTYIFYLIVTNLVDSLVNIISPLFLLEEETACAIFGAIEVTTIYASSVWLILMAVALFNYLQAQNQFHSTKLLLGIGIPIVSAIFALSLGLLGNEQNLQCSMNTVHSNKMFLLYCFSIILPRGAAIIISLILYAKMNRYVRNIPDPDARNLYNETALFPIVYSISSFFLFLDALTVGESFYIALIAYAFRRMIGLFDAVIFFYNPFVKEYLPHLRKRVLLGGDSPLDD